MTAKMLTALVVLAATACSVGAPSASQTSPATATPAASEAAASPTPAAAEPETAWQRAIAQVGPDGRYSLQAALNLFATAYGPLPGVDVEADLGGEEHVDGTLAIQAVMAHAASLTAEQRAAIDAYLAPPPDAEVMTIPPVAEARTRIVLAALDQSTRDAFEESANEFRRQIAARLGRDFAGKIDIFWKDEEGPAFKDGTHTVADAFSDWTGGVFGDCRIRMFRGSQTIELVDTMAILAHEVFHCFQFDAFRTLDNYAITPSWVVEGQATWVEATLAPESACCLKKWDRWLQKQIPLTMRAYDAIGFYGHLSETGVDPWTVFKPMWDAGSDTTLIFNQAGANNEAFLNSWASGTMREPDRGAEWDTDGPGISDASASPAALVLKPGGWIDLSAAFFDVALRAINLEVDAVNFSVDGHVRISDGNLNTTELDDVWYCVQGHDCTDKCETDDEEPPPIAGMIGYVVIAASTGGVDGTVGRATGIKLKQECESPSPSICPDPNAPIEGNAGRPLAMVGGIHVAADCPTPDPTDDEFCTRYKAFLVWQMQHEGTDYELTQPWAAEIANRMEALRPYAPPQLVEHVNLYIIVYRTFATLPEPANLPAVGPDAVGIANAFMAMTGYCGITGPEDI